MFMQPGILLCIVHFALQSKCKICETQMTESALSGTLLVAVVEGNTRKEDEGIVCKGY